MIQNYDGPINCTVPIPSKPTCPTYISDGARNKCLANLKNQKVNFALAFAERTRSARLVESNIRRIAKAVRSIKRGDVDGALNAFGVSPRKGFKHNTKNASQLYLEMEYGWKPLLSDSFNAVQLLNEKDAEDPKRYTLSAVGKFTDHTPIQISTGDTNGVLFQLPHQDPSYGTWSSACKYKYQIKKVFFYKAKCRVDAYLDNSLLGQAASLGLTNPLDVAWELVPWSFVVDWFLPIGNYLGLLDATSGLSFRAGTLTTTAELLQEIVPTEIVYPVGHTATSHSGQILGSSYRDFSLERGLLTDFPQPGLYLSRNPLSGRRIYNAIALLGANIGK
jgi:hypothetical protein